MQNNLAVSTRSQLREKCQQELFGDDGGDDYDDDEVGKIKEVDPDTMDYDIFSGDMMASGTISGNEA